MAERGLRKLSVSSKVDDTNIVVEEKKEAQQKPHCNFCQGTAFVVHMGRDGEKCGGCGSLRRHRVALETYRRRGMFAPRKNDGEPIRVLHLAPEYLLRKAISDAVGGGYMCADPKPEAYGSAKCFNLKLPDAFSIFPDDYFDYVIHNHVLEHIPGSYKDILLQFSRIVKPWGYHIFSVPGPNLKVETEEGGEHMTDAEREKRFGQNDHLRLFGKDLPETLAALPNGQFSWDNISSADRLALNVAPYSNRFLVWRKGRGLGAAK